MIVKVEINSINQRLGLGMLLTIKKYHYFEKRLRHDGKVLVF